MSTYLGVSYGHHDSSAVIVHNNEIVHSIRYGTNTIIREQFNELEAITPAKFDRVFVHENKIRDAWRKLYTGDWDRLFDGFIRLPKWPTFSNHHLSHAAYGYYTSPFRERATVIVADAIGECETLAVYLFDNSYYEKVFDLKYPHSPGLYYSYHTSLVGLKPLKEEHLLMELSQQHCELPDIKETDVDIDGRNFHTRVNFHFKPSHTVSNQGLRVLIARKTQNTLERYFDALLNELDLSSTSPIVFTGGVAMNSLLQERIRNKYTNVYTPKYPGDTGSSLGAVLQYTKTFTDASNLFT